MTPREIFDKLRAELHDPERDPTSGVEAVFDFHDGQDGDKDPWWQVEPYSIEEVAIKLKTDPELHFDYLECITGIDLPDADSAKAAGSDGDDAPAQGQIVVVYHVYSYVKKHRVVLKCFLDREDPALPTVSNVWSAANWQERECFDLLGVLFEGHPDLRRLLMPDDWEGHPLRKDYEEQDDYHGIPTVRPNPVELFAIKLPDEKADKTQTA